jgi:hypothetical protein
MNQMVREDVKLLERADMSLLDGRNGSSAIEK